MREFIEKLFSRLEEYAEYNSFDYYKEEPFINISFEELEDIINELTEEYKGCWIPVSERLPEENGEYIVMIERATRPTFLNYYAGAWFGWDEDGIEYYEVVAWQPLPDPYKEG